ncbi:MAG: peptidylprolyl isomerase [Clostridia bacterium]|nr:peptidylprolyl isomerase [Clostridia bacterium]
MTIGSQKAAQVLTEDITDTYHTLYSVYNAAQKEGFTNDEAVKSAQSNQWEQFKAQFENDGKFNEFLTVHSISENDLKEYMSVYTVYNLYSEKLIGEYLSKTYTESELLKAVDKEYAKVKHILVEDEATAKSIISKLGKGASFDSLVKEYSTDPGQGEDGYTFTKGEMVKEFEDAAFSLNKNSYTKTPVKSAYGYHIIYRYPLSSEWIDENKANFTQIAASSSYREKIDALLESTKISYTQNYQKYISTIE